MASSETDPEYLRWSCERLQHLLDQEDVRRAGIERKALAASAFTLAAASYFAKQLTVGGPRPPVLVGFSLLAFVGVLVTLVLAYRSVVIVSFKGPSSEALGRAEVNAQPSDLSYLGYQQHLTAAIQAFQLQLEPRAKNAQRTQGAALVTTTLLVTILSLIHI